uniref:Uncharacterized protein n=1 Tax=Ciona savignyi TaxID=51511 RepID=H2YQZ3_CIOSA
MSPNLRRKSAPTPDSSTLISNLTRRTLSQMPNPVTPVNGLPSSMYTSSAFMPTILNEPLEKVDEIPIPTGSTGYNDEDYTKALLQHQTDRMNRLRALYGSKKTELITLNGDISILEEKIQERNRRYKSPSSVNSLQDEIGRLREVNRQLEIDCNCMYKEVDLFSRDGDSTREDFYSRYNRPPVKQQPQKQRKG